VCLRTDQRLSPIILRLDPDIVFELCKGLKRRKTLECCDRVQVLLPSTFPSLRVRNLRSPSRLENAGAIIFGHNHKLSLIWGRSSDPEEGESSASNENLALSPHDSGIGSSIGSASSSGGMKQFSTTSPKSTKTSQLEKNGWAFNLSRHKKQNPNTGASGSETKRDVT